MAEKGPYSAQPHLEHQQPQQQRGSHLATEDKDMHSGRHQGSYAEIDGVQG